LLSGFKTGERHCYQDYVNGPRELLDMEKKQGQDSFLLLLIEVHSLSLERPLWVTLNHRAPTSPKLQTWMYANLFDLETRKKCVTHPSRCPFSISSLTMNYFSIHRSREKFCLSQPYYQLLDKRDYFPGDGKGQCILRRPWKAGTFEWPTSLSFLSVGYNLESSPSTYKEWPPRTPEMKLLKGFPCNTVLGGKILSTLFSHNFVLVVLGIHCDNIFECQKIRNL
jgi:hypothetical protein